MVRGSSGGGERVGVGAGVVRDVAGDSLNDISIRSMSPYSHWEIYASRVASIPSTIAYWKGKDTAGVVSVVVGDFYGNHDPMIVFGTETDQWFGSNLYRTSQLHFYQVIDSPVVLQKQLVLPNRTVFKDPFYPTTVLASDLDNDQDDDLVIAIGVHVRAGVRSSIGEIWIYEGGPNFQVDTPTVVLRDTEESNDLRMVIADFNGDHWLDILLAGFKVPGFSIAQYKFFWGKPSLQQLSPYPDHSLTLKNAAVSVFNLKTVADLDGDQIADIAGTQSSQTALFLSGSGKPITQRTFTLEDADRLLLTPKDFFAGQSVGSLGDSTDRSSMLTLYGPDQRGGAMLIALNGDTSEPIDGKYDAYYASSLDSLSAGTVFGYGGPAGDVNGDGWSDYLTAQPKWPGNDAGIAMILAGGPYIPRDDNTTSVQDIPAEGKHDAMAVWPNPVREVLNIAWRGDLQRMPKRFVVHSVAGERIAGGVVDSGVGAAVWQCDGVASGSYVLTAYDDHDWVIARSMIFKL